ncbi:hypothetical protein [uncultured Clostridium sp.]|uniref:hypothetical protein n=1 Tax=uncultured Clostridium sp. TaxID=59620 RepID=UPI0026241476|nr:hypothetical protein [uncultured Clostridium sp.]
MIILSSNAIITESFLFSVILFTDLPSLKIAIVNKNILKMNGKFIKHCDSSKFTPI